MFLGCCCGPNGCSYYGSPSDGDPRWFRVVGDEITIIGDWISSFGFEGLVDTSYPSSIVPRTSVPGVPLGMCGLDSGDFLISSSFIQGNASSVNVPLFESSVSESWVLFPPFPSSHVFFLGGSNAYSLIEWTENPTVGCRASFHASGLSSPEEMISFVGKVYEDVDRLLSGTGAPGYTDVMSGFDTWDFSTGILTDPDGETREVKIARVYHSALGPSPVSYRSVPLSLYPESDRRMYNYSPGDPVDSIHYVEARSGRDVIPGSLDGQFSFFRPPAGGVGTARPMGAGYYAAGGISLSTYYRSSVLRIESVSIFDPPVSVLPPLYPRLHRVPSDVGAGVKPPVRIGGPGSVNTPPVYDVNLFDGIYTDSLESGAFVWFHYSIEPKLKDYIRPDGGANNAAYYRQLDEYNRWFTDFQPSSSGGKRTYYYPSSTPSYVLPESLDYTGYGGWSSDIGGEYVTQANFSHDFDGRLKSAGSDSFADHSFSVLSKTPFVEDDVLVDMSRMKDPADFSFEIPVKSVVGMRPSYASASSPRSRFSNDPDPGVWVDVGISGGNYRVYRTSQGPPAG